MRLSKSTKGGYEMLKRRTLTILTIVAGLLILTAGVATAHFKKWGEFTWVDYDVGCSYVESWLNHGTNKGQFNQGLVEARDHSAGECGAYWLRPKGHIRVKWQLFRKDPTLKHWRLCRSITFHYNESQRWDWKEKRFHGIDAPCGTGTYNLRTWGGVKHEGTWYGFRLVHSFNHEF